MWKLLLLMGNSIALPASAPARRRQMLVSIHDVGPRFGHEIAKLTEHLSRHLSGMRFAMLVVPNHWGAAPLEDDQAFQRQLRQWSDAGVEIFVHGWFHRDEAQHDSALARWKSRQMTAGEGEFLGLSYSQSLVRMNRGRDLIEQAIGRTVAGFIAPAWLYGAGSVAAAKTAGFAVAEDHMKVWSPATGAVLARGPVITWASRSRARIASSLAFAAAARVCLGAQPVVRIAVHPGDTAVPRLMASIDRTLGRFAFTHRPARYCDLLGGGAGLAGDPA